jgi:hypothetical protein
MNIYVEAVEERPDSPTSLPDLDDGQNPEVEQGDPDDQCDCDQERRQRRGHLIECVDQLEDQVEDGCQRRQNHHPRLVQSAVHFRPELARTLAIFGRADDLGVDQPAELERGNPAEPQLGAHEQGREHERRDRIHEEIAPELGLIPDGLPVLQD